MHTRNMARQGMAWQAQGRDSLAIHPARSAPILMRHVDRGRPEAHVTLSRSREQFFIQQCASKSGLRSPVRQHAKKVHKKNEQNQGTLAKPHTFSIAQECADLQSWSAETHVTIRQHQQWHNKDCTQTCVRAGRGAGQQWPYMIRLDSDQDKDRLDELRIPFFLVFSPH